jgi:hypothetical protein
VAASGAPPESIHAQRETGIGGGKRCDYRVDIGRCGTSFRRRRIGIELLLRPAPALIQRAASAQVGTHGQQSSVGARDALQRRHRAWRQIRARLLHPGLLLRLARGHRSVNTQHGG